MSSRIVLCYHALSPSWDAALSTTPASFERQIELLVRRGYRGMRFTDAVRTPEHERVVAITFDDAYRSVIEIGLPILERFGLQATVFVPTDYIGNDRVMSWPGIDRWVDGPFEAELAPMTWSELDSLKQAGWEIGSHTGSHPRLTQLDDAALENELARSKAACEEHLTGPCTSLAYPYGDVDARVVAAAARAGYTAAAALTDDLDPSRVLESPRIGVYQIDSDLRFRLKISPTVRHLRRWRIVRGPQRLVLGQRRPTH